MSGTNPRRARVLNKGGLRPPFTKGSGAFGARPLVCDHVCVLFSRLRVWYCLCVVCLGVSCVCLLVCMLCSASALPFLRSLGRGGAGCVLLDMSSFSENKISNRHGPSVLPIVSPCSECGGRIGTKCRSSLIFHHAQEVGGPELVQDRAESCKSVWKYAEPYRTSQNRAESFESYGIAQTRTESCGFI